MATHLIGTADLHADEIRLTSGEVLIGVVLDETETGIQLDHPILGPLDISHDQIVEITRDDVEAPTEPPRVKEEVEGEVEVPEEPQQEAQGETNAAAEQPTADESTAQGTDEPGPENANARQVAAGESPVAANGLSESLGASPAFWTWLDKWSHRVDLAFAGTGGNTETASYLATYAGNRADDHGRTQLTGRFFYLESNDRVNKHEAFVRLQHDFLFDESDWFPFVRLQWDYNRTKQWEQRYQAFAGVGYTMDDIEDFTAEFRVAGGVVHEAHGDDTTRPEGLISAAVLKYKIDDQSDVSGSATYFPNLEDLGEFRLVTGLEYRVKLESWEGVALKVGVENEYESIVDRNDDHNDYKYYVGLEFRF